LNTIHALFYPTLPSPAVSRGAYWMRRWRCACEWQFVHELQGCVTHSAESGTLGVGAVVIASQLGCWACGLVGARRTRASWGAGAGDSTQPWARLHGALLQARLPAARSPLASRWRGAGANPNPVSDAPRQVMRLRDESASMMETLVRAKVEAAEVQGARAPPPAPARLLQNGSAHLLHGQTCRSRYILTTSLLL